jgi:hypothetical protein
MTKKGGFAGSRGNFLIESSLFDGLPETDFHRFCISAFWFEGYRILEWHNETIPPITEGND